MNKRAIIRLNKIFTDFEPFERYCLRLLFLLIEFQNKALNISERKTHKIKILSSCQIDFQSRFFLVH